MGAGRRAGAFLAVATLLLAGCTDDAGDEPDGDEVDEPGPRASPTFARVEVGGLRGEVGEVELHDVHGDGAGWIAVGATTEPGGEPQAAVLASKDGEAFSALELPLPETPGHRARAVTRLPEAAVVAGTATGDGETHLVVWTGTDEGWQVRPAEDVGSWAGLAVNNATAVGDHAVVVGTMLDEDGARRPAAWRVAADGAVTAAEVDMEEGFLRDVAGTSERLLAVGGSADGEPFVLRSEDQGDSWQPADADGLDGAEVHVLEADGDGWLAGGRVGAEGRGEAAVWGSDDGETWELLNDPERWGRGNVRAVHRLDDRLVALGTWLHVEEVGENEDDGGLDLFDDEDDGWREPQWPGPGEHGWFGVAAEHGGRVVAVGGVHDTVTSLRTATSPDEWDRLPVAEQLLERTEGVLSRWIASLAGDGEVLVGVGGELVLEGDVVSRGLFAGLAPEFAPAAEPARGPGQLRSVAHDAEHGFVAVGSRASPGFDHAGVRALVSADGRGWSELAVAENGDDDRAQVVLPLDRRVLVAGLTWEDDEPVSYLWELADDGLRRLDIELDGFGVVDGCAGGQLAALEVFPGDETRLLAVSQDSGRSFSLVGETPLTVASDLECAVSGAGELLVAAQGGAGARLYHVDAEGSFDEVEVELGDEVEVAAVRHLSEVGWMVLASVVEDGARRGAVHLSRDLEQWTTGRLETTAEATDLRDAAVAGGRLFLLGSEDGAAAMWQLGLEELAVAGASQRADIED